jgi:hypothetical protein
VVTAGTAVECHEPTFSPIETLWNVRLHQSALAPENLTTLAHFSISSPMNLPKSPGESARTVTPARGQMQKLSVGKFHAALPIVLTVPQSKCGNRKDLPLETRKQFSHLHTNALECRTCCARRKIRFACGCIAEGALPRDIWLAAITTRMLNEYFAGWKAD